VLEKHSERILGAGGFYRDRHYEKMTDNYRRIRRGKCETYTEWVSDVLHSAIFHTCFDASSNASDDWNNCKGHYIVRLFLAREKICGRKGSVDFTSFEPPLHGGYILPSV
jgi:hypothetical protein